MRPSFLQMLISRLSGRDFIHEFYCKEKHVLDVGCGEGEFLRRSPKTIEGIEPNEDVVKRLVVQGLKVTKGALPNLPFQDGSFDVVHSRNVIEHLDIPTAYSIVSEGSRLLKEGGLLIIASEVVTKEFWDTFGHVKPYSTKALLKLLNEKSREEFAPVTGLKHIATIYLGNYYRNKILYFLSCLIAYYLPFLRREYFIVFKKEKKYLPTQ
ncbi:MAG: class I SAM-dependent methyltransferase [Candidatus Kaiserbacteria bacterium]|nr:class I SAM-dependent methyltransferase [Candidatus Kaiserbacteria bacterium]